MSRDPLVAWSREVEPIVGLLARTAGQAEGAVVAGLGACSALSQNLGEVSLQGDRWLLDHPCPEPLIGQVLAGPFRLCGTLAAAFRLAAAEEQESGLAVLAEMVDQFGKEVFMMIQTVGDLVGDQKQAKK